MKVITESILRDELRATQPETYYIPEGKILSPAAREYLQQRKISISKQPAPQAAPPVLDQHGGAAATAQAASAAAPGPGRFVDYETGSYYLEKPEHMTHLRGNILITKNHPRIVFRGKLDSLQAQIVLAQAILAETTKDSPRLIEDLGSILVLLREIMRCDVLEIPLANLPILGLDHAQLRERSHDPMKFFKIQQMVQPDYTMGRTYALLNQTRTMIRETESAATEAYREGTRYNRSDIIETFNRLSSALHIIMCQYLAGHYRKEA